MCGRLVATLPHDAMAQLFDAVPDNDLPAPPNYNLCPTQMVSVVTRSDLGRRFRAMRWGLVPGWYKTVNDGPLIINARAETIATKPAFREAGRSRRCILPISGFYEWSAGQDGARLPWYITRADTAPMALAAVWHVWQGADQAIATCAVVTTEAGPGISPIHNREPVILEPADWPLWLGEAGHGAAVLMKATRLGVLASHRVDRAVNSNRASGSALIEVFTDAPS
jgi:putative SOS response-associated peptidase YedK